MPIPTILSLQPQAPPTGVTGSVGYGTTPPAVGYAGGTGTPTPTPMFPSQGATPQVIPAQPVQQPAPGWVLYRVL